MGAVMAVALSHGTKVWRRREGGAQFAIWLAWLAAAAIFIYCWQLISDKTIWAFVTDAPEQAADLAVRMVPPDWSLITKLGRPLWDTLNIATLGTAIALVAAVPVAYCAARNTTPNAALVRPVALFIIVSSRSINSLIWALMLVTIIGPGVLAGILAIGLRSIGFCAKLLYEAIEEIDESQVEAVRATGASGAQVTAYGIVPQVLPAFAGISVFRWDINIRESTVLGLVGAGGIGLPLNAAITTLAWTKVSLILLIIIATVIVSEWVSAKVRHAIM
jgi:phosphonate transport system permease protein